VLANNTRNIFSWLRPCLPLIVFFFHIKNRSPHFHWERYQFRSDWNGSFCFAWTLLQHRTRCMGQRLFQSMWSRASCGTSSDE